jgi:hypothetical protein
MVLMTKLFHQAVESISQLSEAEQDEAARLLLDFAERERAAREAKRAAPRDVEAMMAKVKEIQERFAALPGEPFNSADIDAILYDEDGLPK